MLGGNYPFIIYTEIDPLKLGVVLVTCTTLPTILPVLLLPVPPTSTHYKGAVHPLVVVLVVVRRVAQGCRVALAVRDGAVDGILDLLSQG